MDLPVAAQNSPYAVELKAGEKYWWCTCGLSKTQPFCDGAHKGSGLKSKMFEVTETKTYYLCGCKRSNPDQQPFCDGTHSK